jgi:dephospho-CoA kinase
MTRIGIIGDIGAGKSYIAKLFGYPVFDADKEVGQLYKKSKKCYKKLKKSLPNFITSFPIKKSELSNAILANQKNIKKIVKIIHPEIRIKMDTFIKKNRKRKFVVLDIPLLIENKINRKNDVLVFVSAPKKEINKRLLKRLNFKPKIVEKFKKIQLNLQLKKKKSDFIIKNNFTKKYLKKDVKRIMQKILNDRNNT